MFFGDCAVVIAAQELVFTTNLGGYITDAGEMNLKRVAIFAGEIGKMEESVLRERRMREKRIQVQCIVLSLRSSSLEVGCEEEESGGQEKPPMGCFTR